MNQSSDVPTNLRETTCSCHPQLVSLLNGTMSSDDEQAMQNHLEDCAECRAFIERTTESLIGESMRGVLPNEAELDIAIQNLIDQPNVDTANASLEFLHPSERPDSIGRFGNYEILEEIGRGGMGIVLKGFEPGLDRIEAVKVLAPQLATTRSARLRFHREARAAAAISHDHVVTVYCVDETDGLPFLVMEFVNGVSLQERIETSAPLDLLTILRIGMQTASGLAAAHSQGLVHRDIKPANILLANGIERVTITDFGLARAIDDVGMTQTGFVTGTPQYMSPEQARGEAVDHRSDLFSLGAVLYAMCAAKPPFQADSTLGLLRQISDTEPPWLSTANPNIPEWLARIVHLLLAKNPADRMQSASEVAELLERHLAHEQQASIEKPALVRRITPHRTAGQIIDDLIESFARRTGKPSKIPVVIYSGVIVFWLSLSGLLVPVLDRWTPSTFMWRQIHESVMAIPILTIPFLLTIWFVLGPQRWLVKSLATSAGLVVTMATMQTWQGPDVWELILFMLSAAIPALFVTTPARLRGFVIGNENSLAFESNRTFGIRHMLFLMVFVAAVCGLVRLLPPMVLSAIEFASIAFGQTVLGFAAFAVSFCLWSRSTRFAIFATVLSMFLMTLLLSSKLGNSPRQIAFILGVHFLVAQVVFFGYRLLGYRLIRPITNGLPT